MLDYACIKLNQMLDGKEYRNKKIRVINIEHHCDTYTVKPKMSNSGTWYDRTALMLRAWYECSKTGEILL